MRHRIMRQTIIYALFGGEEAKVFDSVKEAAKAAKVSPSAVSQAISGGGLCAGAKWRVLSRVYAVKNSDGKYALCRWSPLVRGFVVMGEDERFGSAVSAKDVSEVFYCGRNVL